MNTLYVKQYNELGELINRVDGNLRHKFPNRRARRARTPRDFNNKKSFPLVVVGNQKFRKRLQFVGDKKIIHYDEAK